MSNKNFMITVYIFLSLIVVLFIYVISNKDYDCKDFKTQTEAQKQFDKYDYDKYSLDHDKDGFACEFLPNN